MSIFEKLRSGVLTVSPEETQDVGVKLVKDLPDNCVVALSGDLGAGKTTLTKGIGAGLGIDPDEVISPTFQIYSIYEGERQLVHIDAYRLEGAEGLEALMIEEFLKEPWTVVIEWPERGMCDWMNENLVEITLERIFEGEISISLKS